MAGSMVAKVPTAPEIAQVATSARAATSRARQRANSAWACAIFSPKVTGSAWMPCERPITGVSLCSKARRFSASRRASMSAIRMSDARASCTARQVSSTSEEVMPWCTKRASGPMNSARWVRKAMTSCFVTRSISSIRATSTTTLPALSQIASALSCGITPSSAIASQACASISNQMRNRVCGSHTATMSGRE